MIFAPSIFLILVTIAIILTIPYGTPLDRWLIWIVLAELIVPTLTLKALTKEL